MSIKHALRQAVDSLPESVTLEEAFERLYSAFKMKQARGQELRPLAGSAHLASPRLVHPEEADDFRMEVTAEEPNARL